MILIKNGIVVTAKGEIQADVFAEGETVTMMGRDLDLNADVVVDAAGKYVLPGGVDVHTHMDSPAFGTVSCDDFTTGTTAAAFGGTTTIVDFAAQMPGEAIPEGLANWHEKLERCPPLVDVGFHLIVTDLAEGSRGKLADLARLPNDGVTSVKLFMAYKGFVMVDDEMMFRVLDTARDAGILTMVHAENGHIVDVLTKRLVAEGKTEPRWHAVSRPPLVEAEATARALRLARLAAAPVYIVHVSCGEAIEPLRHARDRGWEAYGETCTQYLFVDETALDAPGFEGAKAVFTPPPRPRHNQEIIWRALHDDDLTVVSSDHSPWLFESQKSLGSDDFSKIPNGAPGVEHRLQMLWHHGVSTGRLSRSRFVELTATNPARLLGLYPRKGTVAVGADADLVVWNPEKRAAISASTHHSRIDYNLFEGVEVTGVPELVTVRGTVVVDGSKLTARPGHGRFLRRSLFGGTQAA
jgi:dihydropyrimidinase